MPVVVTSCDPLSPNQRWLYNPADLRLSVSLFGDSYCLAASADPGPSGGNATQVLAYTPCPEGGDPPSMWARGANNTLGLVGSAQCLSSVGQVEHAAVAAYTCGSAGVAQEWSAPSSSFEGVVQSLRWPSGGPSGLCLSTVACVFPSCNNVSDQGNCVFIVRCDSGVGSIATVPVLLTASLTAAALGLSALRLFLAGTRCLCCVRVRLPSPPNFGLFFGSLAIFVVFGVVLANRIVSSAFCIHHAQLLIGGAATLLPASLFLILESLRELWLHDFRQSVAPPFWRFAFISGVLATIGSWVTLLAAYTALVSMGVKGSYNLSFKTASCVLHAAPVLLFILAHRMQEVSLASVERLFKSGGIVHRLYGSRSTTTPGSVVHGAASSVPGTGGSSPNLISNQDVIELRPMHRCDRVGRGCPCRRRLWVGSLVVVYITIVGSFLAIVWFHPSSTIDGDKKQQMRAASFYAGGLVITDGALCILHFKGIQKSVFRSLLFVVAVRLAVVPFSTQHWFAVICLMFVGFNVCVAKDASQAVFPMQSPSDVVLGIIRRCATMAEPSGSRIVPTLSRKPAAVIISIVLGVVLAAFGGATIAVWQEQDSLGPFRALGLHSNQYFDFGILLLVWVPIYMLLQFLFSAMEWYLPSAAPPKAPFEAVWLLLALWNDLKLLCRKRCCCRQRRATVDTGPLGRVTSAGGLGRATSAGGAASAASAAAAVVDEYTLLPTLYIWRSRVMKAPSTLRRECGELKAFLRRPKSGAVPMGILWVPLVVLGFFFPAILRQRGSSVKVVQAYSVLAAIVAVVWLPFMRIWKAMGYRYSPPLLLSSLTVVTIAVYEIVVRYYLEVHVPRDQVWLARSISLAFQLIALSFLLLDIQRAIPGFMQFMVLIAAVGVSLSMFYFMGQNNTPGFDLLAALTVTLTYPGLVWHVYETVRWGKAGFRVPWTFFQHKVFYSWLWLAGAGLLTCLSTRFNALGFGSLAPHWRLVCTVIPASLLGYLIILYGITITQGPSREWTIMRRVIFLIRGKHAQGCHMGVVVWFILVLGAYVSVNFGLHAARARWRVWIGVNVLVLVAALQIRALPVFVSFIPSVKMVFGTSFFPAPALRVDVRTGSVSDVSRHLVCHYLAWLLVGHWAVAGVILSSPCYSGMFLYPLMANVSIVVLLVTTFLCRRSLSCVPELAAALVTLSRTAAALKSKSLHKVDGAQVPNAGPGLTSRSPLLGAATQLWIPRQMVLRACNPAFRSVDAKVLESIPLVFGPQYGNSDRALSAADLAIKNDWARTTLERSAIFVALAVSRAAAERELALSAVARYCDDRLRRNNVQVAYRSMQQLSSDLKKLHSLPIIGLLADQARLLPGNRDVVFEVNEATEDGGSASPGPGLATLARPGPIFRAVTAPSPSSDIAVSRIYEVQSRAFHVSNTLLSPCPFWRDRTALELEEWAAVEPASKLKQGDIGDCWLLSAMTAVTSSQLRPTGHRQARSDLIVKPVLDRFYTQLGGNQGWLFHGKVRLVDPLQPCDVGGAREDCLSDPMAPNTLSIKVNNLFPVLPDGEAEEPEDLMYVADENNWGTFIEKAVALHRFVRLGHRGKLETPRTLTVKGVYDLLNMGNLYMGLRYLVGGFVWEAPLSSAESDLYCSNFVWGQLLLGKAQKSLMTASTKSVIKIRNYDRNSQQFEYCQSTPVVAPALGGANFAGSGHFQSLQGRVAQMHWGRVEAWRNALNRLRVRAQGKVNVRDWGQAARASGLSTPLGPGTLATPLIPTLKPSLSQGQDQGCFTFDRIETSTRSTSSPRATSERARVEGLVPSHAYAIVDVQEVTLRQNTDLGEPRRVRMIKLRNPHGSIVTDYPDNNIYEWSPSHPSWLSTEAEQLRQGLPFKEAMEELLRDGEMWITWEAFLRYFATLAICKVQLVGDGNDPPEPKFAAHFVCKNALVEHQPSELLPLPLGPSPRSSARLSSVRPAPMDLGPRKPNKTVFQQVFSITVVSGTASIIVGAWSRHAFARMLLTLCTSEGRRRQLTAVVVQGKENTRRHTAVLTTDVNEELSRGKYLLGVEMTTGACLGIERPRDSNEYVSVGVFYSGSANLTLAVVKEWNEEDMSSLFHTAVGRRFEKTKHHRVWPPRPKSSAAFIGTFSPDLESGAQMWGAGAGAYAGGGGAGSSGYFGVGSSIPEVDLGDISLLQPLRGPPSALANAGGPLANAGGPASGVGSLLSPRGPEQVPPRAVTLELSSREPSGLSGAASVNSARSPAPL